MPIMPRTSSRTRPAVAIRAPLASDERAFVERARASRALHARWVDAPDTPAAFRAWLARGRARPAGFRGFVVVAPDEGLVGVCNLSEIVYGPFKSAYLGYYAFAGAAGRGLMSAGLALVLDAAFDALALHRVEANVQPENTRSLAFLVRNGFTREGYSRRYLKIGGRWRDHVRFAMLAEDWRGRRR
jgi:ribosomal-protein-alanine N-acetyltransferase